MKRKLSVLALGVTTVLMVSACSAEAAPSEKPVPPVQTVQTVQTVQDVQNEEGVKAEATEDLAPVVEQEPVVEVEPVVNVEPVSEAEPEAEPQEIYTFDNCNEVVYATSSVNLRRGPGTEYDKVGSMGTGESVTCTGIGTGDYSSWSRVNLADGSIVYVSSNYISTTKPVVQQTSGGTTQNKTNNNGTTTSTGGYTDGKAEVEAAGMGLGGLLGYDDGSGVEHSYSNLPGAHQTESGLWEGSDNGILGN